MLPRHYNDYSDFDEAWRFCNFTSYRYYQWCITLYRINISGKFVSIFINVHTIHGGLTLFISNTKNSVMYVNNFQGLNYRICNGPHTVNSLSVQNRPVLGPKEGSVNRALVKWQNILSFLNCILTISLHCFLSWSTIPSQYQEERELRKTNIP